MVDHMVVGGVSPTVLTKIAQILRLAAFIIILFLLVLDPECVLRYFWLHFVFCSPHT